MRTYSRVTFEQRKVGGRLYVEVFGSKDGDTYRIDTFFADTFKEASDMANAYIKIYERGAT